MPCFPFFIDIEGREGLIIGGGKHALEKVRRLLPYGPVLRVIASKFMEAFEEPLEGESVELV
ncbi:MAG: NAD(P)-dependent oxidoreductase [Lachnospiraceae bacterium]|nr:NAD(P)-dependent oxidoreductase [Lachnospiraceae bacterium]